jgi:hypothetical protein
MSNATEHEYKVLMTHLPAAKSKGRQRWQATLLDFPNIVEEAFSRDQAINQIKTRLADMLIHAEIITLHAPALAIETNGMNNELTAQGWGDHGLFKDDADALKIFEEIEHARDSHSIEGQ